jgi:hypothetical protein
MDPVVWIEPNGTLHSFDYPHEKWAYEWLTAHPDQVIKDRVEFGQRWGTENLLLAGWVRVLWDAVEIRKPSIGGAQLRSLQSYYAEVAPEKVYMLFGLYGNWINTDVLMKRKRVCLNS